MAKKIQAWTTYGPRLALALPVTSEEFVENLVQATNLSRGSVLAFLAELDDQLESNLRVGRPVHLPNGMHFRPIGRRDGSIRVEVRINPKVTKRLNGDFRGKWQNAENVGKSEVEIIALWNAQHPDDTIPS